MTNKALFSIIAILLAGLLSVSIIHALDDSATPSATADIGNHAGNAGEEPGGNHPPL
ncbi:MAG: hypothetical protein R3F47_17125 [Gammaproteobacteria bacterium]